MVMIVDGRIKASGLVLSKKAVVLVLVLLLSTPGAALACLLACSGGQAVVPTPARKQARKQARRPASRIVTQ